MSEHYLTLIIVGIGFLAYFLIIAYGPYLYDVIFNNSSKEAKE